MAENLMNVAHKATNENYRANYDAIFRGVAVDKDKNVYRVCRCSPGDCLEGCGEEDGVIGK